MLFSLAVLALLASAQGRAVNISNTWVLPEEGFPVFYRYFRDRISWYEADAVCQFHHANLVTVDTTAQYDAVRAYLKELDISSAVWVGLIRSNPDGDFTWTDYRGLSGDGYWSSAPDSRSAPLCAAADPAADYRWEARACGGPTVASFICELPVPQWALGNEGCMIRALPALTILYLPESAAVQLTADCGMAGVKKVQCTGNVKREDLLKELSCADEEEPSTTSNSMTTGSNLPVSTDFSITDQDTINEVTEEVITTEHESEIYHPEIIIATSKPSYIYTDTHFQSPTKLDNFNNYNIMSKNINLGENNIHSNFIPKIVDEDNVLTNDQLEKLEDERNMQHKMLHEEIARVGNVENIFTQPTDHFIPPLVMAKAKISDDMTVLSLAEKHAQQLAEKQFNKQNLNNNPIDHSYPGNYVDKTTANIDKPLITSLKPSKVKDAKKEASKSNLPKKYINEKHYDVKSKTLKNIETKTTEAFKPTEISSTTESTTKYIDTTTKKIRNIDDDLGMELTVMLKDAPLTSEETSFAGDMARIETIKNAYGSNKGPETHKQENISQSKDASVSTTTESIENITMKHEVIKITLVTDNPTATTNVFEITTKMPIFQDNHTSNKTSTTPLPVTQLTEEIHSSSSVSTTMNEITTATTKMMEIENTTSPVTYSTSTISTTVTDSLVTTIPPIFTSTPVINITESIGTTHTSNIPNKTEVVLEAKTVASTTSLPITTTELDKNINNTTVVNDNVNDSTERADEYNGTDIIHDVLDKNLTDSEEIDDFQSPLLSGAVEPMHRPPRTRRPQQPNRNKFNPFRILG